METAKHYDFLESTKPSDFLPLKTWYLEYGQPVFNSDKLLHYHTKPIQRDLIDAGAMATELSRQLLQQANPSIEQMVRDDFVNVVSAAVDLAMLHGDDIKQPLGLVPAVTGTGSLATLTWANVLKVIEGLGANNINPNYWLTSPQIATILRSTLKEAGLPGYLMENGQLAGLPVAISKHLANKAGTPAKGRMILGDFTEMIIGTWGSVDILANPYAEGPYSRGAVQVRILTTMDMVPRRSEAFALIEDIGL